MGQWTDVTIGELLRSVARYRAFIIFLAGIFLVSLVAPGSRLADGPSSIAQPGAARDFGSGQSSTGVTTVGGDEVATGSTAATGSAAAGTAGSAGARVGGATSGVATVAAPASVSGGGDPLAAPDCDKSTGRIKYPSVYAPPCVPAWPAGADNGGSTARGITKDEILVAIRFNPNPDPAGQAVLLAAGVDDTSEEVRATRAGYVDLLQNHFRSYGRKVKLVYVEQSGTDEQAQRADAIRIATEIKAFAVWGGGGAFKDELVARGVLCAGCTTSEPIENYLNAAPYVWSTLMASSQAYIHRAEFVGKRLWGGKAQWAGDPIYQQQTRKLAIVYIDTTTNTYKAGVDFFETELAKYGAKLTDRVSYLGDLATAQEQSRVIIARLKDKGITSVVFSGDPIAPAFLTKEATNQNYRPEWIITGSALTDTTLFARTYDQAQWSHAFGVSMLAARAPHEGLDPWRLYVWHHGTTPPADDSYGVIYPTPWMFFTGMHLAGPKLTVETFRDGLFSFPVSGVGGITNVQVSFGRHGIWPWDDYLANDDMTEIWWDPSAQGPDETGKTAVGMYQYVEGGKRYSGGEWPKTPPKSFDPSGAITLYNEQPAADKPPSYEHQKH